jgi:hypothetical protein
MHGSTGDGDLAEQLAVEAIGELRVGHGGEIDQPSTGGAAHDGVDVRHGGEQGVDRRRVLEIDPKGTATRSGQHLVSSRQCRHNGPTERATRSDDDDLHEPNAALVTGRPGTGQDRIMALEVSP